MQRGLTGGSWKRHEVGLTAQAAAEQDGQHKPVISNFFVAILRPNPDGSWNQRRWFDMASRERLMP